MNRLNVDFDRIRYDLALIYARSNYELLLSKDAFKQPDFPEAAEMYGELDFLMAAFGRAYREMCFVPDKDLMGKMNFTQDDFEMLDTLAADKQR